MIEIRLGSDSDLPKIKPACDLLESVGVSPSVRVLSAHRTPALSGEEARNLEKNGFKVSIAAAGGAAHLPGTTAAETVLPVLGIPIGTEHLAGLDSLYSILQMPEGIPVGTLGVAAAEAAGKVAASIAALGDAKVAAALRKRLGLSGTAGPLGRQVAVVKAAGSALPAKKVEDALKLLGELGLTAKEYAGSASAATLEKDGASVIVVLADAASIDLPARLSAESALPVVGVPVSEPKPAAELATRLFGAGDAPVAGMGINRFRNAAIFAAQVVGAHDREVREKVRGFKDGLRRDSTAKDEKLRKLGVAEYLKGMK
jgi:5-(carboxyamino)imidazole ribonucleotide mutase